jgi:hypothetical protein
MTYPENLQVMMNHHIIGQRRVTHPKITIVEFYQANDILLKLLPILGMVCPMATYVVGH